MSDSGGASHATWHDRWNGFVGDLRVAPNEHELWLGFLQEHDWPFTRLSFEFRVVGSGGYRTIDVVGETEDSIFLFELKNKGSMEALGQLLTYQTLYQWAYRPTKPVKLVLVHHTLPQVLLGVFVAHGIELIRVPEIM